jgi:hypothetical protein
VSGRRVVLAVLAVAALVLLPVTGASAGGPTSVLLVVPGTGRTASLYVTQPEYEELSRLVGTPGSAAPGDRTTSPPSSREVSLTWLLHDVSVWRVDHVSRGAGGQAWIATELIGDGSGASGGEPTWRAAAAGSRLLALLGRLGVDPDAGALPSSSVAPLPTVAVTAAPVAAVAAGAGEGAAPAPTRAPAWSWLVAGLAGLVGLGAGVAVTRLTGGQRGRVVRRA